MSRQITRKDEILGVLATFIRQTIKLDEFKQATNDLLNDTDPDEDETAWMLAAEIQNTIDAYVIGELNECWFLANLLCLQNQYLQRSWLRNNAGVS